ncbi:MAG: metal-dependent hydrolase [Thermoplasmatota archaeon]
MGRDRGIVLRIGSRSFSLRPLLRALVVSFTILVLLPLLTFLSIPALDRRKVWVCLPLTFLPDLDYFIGVHREWLHNVWVLIPFLAILAYGLARSDRNWIQWGTIATGYVASHLIMDIFVGGETLFWPLFNTNYCYYATIDVATATNTPLVSYGSCVSTGAPTVSTLYTFLDYPETAEWAFVLATLATLGIVGLVKRARRATLAPPSTPRVP